MRSHLTPLLAAAVATACASGAPQPTFEFQPASGPLRYMMTSEDNNVVETPMGTQESTSNVEVTVVLETGQRTADGVAVTATYESFGGSSSDQGTFSGGAIVGEPYTGTILSDGIIEITDGPETPSSLRQFTDPRGLLREFLMPLPPSADVESWEVRRETTFDQMFELTSVTAGTARIAGDTTWNGVAAKVIVLDATVTVNGSGMPPGSPAEVEITLEGPVTFTYVWDAARGVMLGAAIVGETPGDVTVVGMDMTFPIVFESTGKIELQQ